MKKGMCYLMSVRVVLLLSASIVEAIVITSLPYTITQKGFYTISNNLKSSGNGIVVNTDNVTIDLKGYTISGNGTGTYYGIYMNGRSNVEIRNGTIRNFGSHGIYEESTSGHSHRVINVSVMNNNGIGFNLANGNNCRVKDCPPFAREPTSSAMGGAVVSNTIAASAAAPLVTIVPPVAVTGSIDPLDATLRHVGDPDKPTG